jgi:arsenite oxidase small subunit
MAVRRAKAVAGSDKAVANLADLAEPWSAVKFSLPDPDDDQQPCIVIRLPGGGWYASSLICSHNKCEMTYVKDPSIARSAFDVDTSTPVLACPCHFSVFDLLRNGQVIAGPAPSPPPQLIVEVRDQNIFVSR